MEDFKDIDECYYEIIKDTNEAFKTEINDFLKETMIEVINEVVYNGYYPTLYTDNGKEPYRRRRKKGGFSDKENIEITINTIGNNLIINMENITKGRFEDVRLDEIIISGEGYDWKDSKIYAAESSGYPIERDFIKETQFIIDQTDVIGYLLEEKLRQKGWL